MTGEIKLEVRGGPAHKKRGWSGIERAVEEQVQELLEALSVGGEFVLIAEKNRPGGPKHKGLRVQRYDSSDSSRPSVLFVAQPGGNDTCWLWRLQCPRGTDVQLLLAQIQLELEKEEKPDTASPASNVVALRPEISDSRTTPTEIKQPADVGKILVDQMRMASILARLVQMMSERQKKGLWGAVTRHEAFQAIKVALGEAYSLRAVGSVLEALQRRGYLTVDEDDLILSPKGEVFMQEHAQKETSTTVEVTRTRETETARVTIEQAPQKSLAEQVRDVAKRATVFQRARDSLPVHVQKLAEIDSEVEKLTAERAQLLELREQTEALKAAAEKILSNPSFVGAEEEYKKLREILGS